MRAVRQPRHTHDEEESVFVSMTDMMVSFLFIMLLLLAFFAVNYSKDDVVSLAEVEELEVSLQRATAELAEAKQAAISERKDDLEAFNTAAQDVQSKILMLIEQKLRARYQPILDSENILVEVSGDALRFKGAGLFEDDSDVLTGETLNIVRNLGDLTLEAIACFTENTLLVDRSACNPNGVMVEAVQIEGHTDDVGSNAYNLRLSSSRAQSAFFAMEEERPDILNFRNSNGQPVVSVAGYGEMRPVTPNTPDNRSENRRVDLRIIMHTAGNVQEMLAIQHIMAHGFPKMSGSQ